MAADTKERIVACATELFGTRGYYSTSMQDIAEAAGVRSGLTYYYFKNKEDLLFDIMYRAMTHIHRVTTLIGEQEYDGLVKVVATSVVRGNSSVTAPVMALIAHQNLINDVFTDEHRTEYLQVRHAVSALMRQFVADGQRAGAIGVPDTRMATLAVIGLGDSVRNWYVPGGTLSIDEITEMTADLAVKMLRPPGANGVRFRDVFPAAQRRILVEKLDTALGPENRYWSSLLLPEGS